jgi:hypothetical protein
MDYRTRDMERVVDLALRDLTNYLREGILVLRRRLSSVSLSLKI